MCLGSRSVERYIVNYANLYDCLKTGHSIFCLIHLQEVIITFELYGTERDRPSLKNTEGRGAHGIPNNQTAFNVCHCAECLRLHSKHKFYIDDKVVLKRNILFSCGSTLKDVKPLSYPSDNPQTKSLFEQVFVRESLNCEMRLEVMYYSVECFVFTVHATRNLHSKQEYVAIEERKMFLREKDSCLSQLNGLQKNQKSDSLISTVFLSDIIFLFDTLVVLYTIHALFMTKCKIFHRELLGLSSR